MAPFLAHYRSLNDDEKPTFIAQLGSLLTGTSDHETNDDQKTIGLKVLLVESGQAQEWATLTDLVGRLTMARDVYKVIRPALKEWVVYNNVDAIRAFQKAILQHSTIVSHTQKKHGRLDLSHESIWRPLFNTLSRAPDYVNIKDILSIISPDLNIREFTNLFIQRLQQIRSDSHTNVEFFIRCYETIIAHKDCKDHYPKYIMFRFITPLSDKIFEPLLTKMCTTISFRDVMEKGPSEDFSFPPDGDEWVSFLYNPPEQLEADNWLHPVYLQAHNRHLGIERIIALTQAYENNGIPVVLREMPGVECLFKNVGARLDPILGEWFTQRMLTERLNQAVENSSPHPTTVRKI